MKGQARVVIENVKPSVDGGKFFVKKIVGQTLKVTFDFFVDGHDVISGRLLYRRENAKKWIAAPIHFLGNDAWEASFLLEKQGFYEYTLEGWVDYALNWQHGLQKKHRDGQHVQVELKDGVQYLEQIKSKAKAAEKKYINQLIKLFQDEKTYDKAVEEALSTKLEGLLHQYPAKKFAVRYDQNLKVWVDRKKANFSAWYEFFPRSASQTPGQHGTFADCERLLPRVAEMGFDTLYFPPIHPIGEVNRKGRNNSTTAKKGEPGSPWGIGSKHGGHKAVHPELGTMADYERLIKKAKKLGIEVAMDFALQCAPDHPYVKDHPEWFVWRSDGTVQYAENPPKKYQDILPIHFECDDWENLWQELLSIALFWIEKGVQVFRVDNPHTKPFRFWQWFIAEIKQKHPDVLFLSEAFSRPAIMHQLAKVGFSQSYCYFNWRNTKEELTEYLTELTTSPSVDYFRPNFWPTTPDINPYILQSGHESTYLSRFFLAATLSSNYGIYGPAYEYLVHQAVPGKEEFLDSEKYECRHWDWNKSTRLKELMGLVNRIRKENDALQSTDNIQFCAIENPQILAYFKQSPDKTNNLLIVVNLDPYYKQSGWVQVPLDQLGKKEGDNLTMNDLITGVSYNWTKEWNYVELQPNLPFHLFRIS